MQFALGVEELADDGPLIEVRRTQVRFPERELPIYKASAIGLLTRRELNVGGEGRILRRQLSNGLQAALSHFDA